MLKSIAKKTISKALVSTYALRGTKNKPRILMYHAIGTDIPEDHVKNYNLCEENFSSQMTTLASYKIVDIHHASEGTVITFDDGYKDNLTTALPILEKYRLPCTIFVTSNNIDASDDFLSTADLQSLARHPLVTLGTHGVSHCRLSECDDDKLHHEVSDSKEKLEDIIDNVVTTMSYPHGDVDDRVIKAVKKAGYGMACCSKFGAFDKNDSPYLMKRTDIWASDTINDFKHKLAGHWDWMAWRT